MSDTLIDESRGLLSRLVEFDTTSRRSNLPLIEFVDDYLHRLGIATNRLPSADGQKASLYAVIGPTSGAGGAILSAHTDVVPTDGQPWGTNPFVLVEKDEKYFARGSADMKTFIACALATIPLFQKAILIRPICLALSYDEEVGCLGAPALIEKLRSIMPPQTVVVVGEPSNMTAVGGHKGIELFRVDVRGKEAHSSIPHLGLSANMAAVRLMEVLRQLSLQFEAKPHGASLFDPSYPTLTIGTMNGGTAVNILARDCTFTFDFRYPPGIDPNASLSPFFEELAKVDRELRSQFLECGVKLKSLASVPAFAFERNSSAELLVRKLTGDIGPLRAVSYSSEAGQFQKAGFSTVICGPGSIEQAHQANEYVEKIQIQKCADFMGKLAGYSS
jgi:acetylornithine deacetylase